MSGHRCVRRFPFLFGRVFIRTISQRSGYKLSRGCALCYESCYERNFIKRGVFVLRRALNFGSDISSMPYDMILSHQFLVAVSSAKHQQKIMVKRTEKFVIATFGNNIISVGHVTKLEKRYSPRARDNPSSRRNTEGSAETENRYKMAALMFSCFTELWRPPRLACLSLLIYCCSLSQNRRDLCPLGLASVSQWTNEVRF